MAAARSATAARFAADGGFIAASSSAAVACVAAFRLAADSGFTVATSFAASLAAARSTAEPLAPLLPPVLLQPLGH